jgi:hypothetical protein
MRSDPDFGKRIAKKVQDIKQDKQNLLNVANEYETKYKEEIIEGTKLRNRLLTEGNQQGLSEEQVMQNYGKFCPTIYTPLLNFLYFMLRETEDVDRTKYQQRDKINEALVKAGQLSHEDGEKDLSSDELNALIDEKMKELRAENLIDERRQQVNKQFLEEEHDQVQFKKSPEMVEFLYGNITLETFNKIKKLKALSKSPNEQEAFQAYRKAIELCKEHNLEFDKIPCYVNKPK